MRPGTVGLPKGLWRKSTMNENVSGDAWQLWEERMKMLLNEYRLMPWQQEAQQMSIEV